MLELVAVMAIFSLVALIGVQVMQASLRNAERLSAVSDESAGLAHGLAMLRLDLESAVPRGFVAPEGTHRDAFLTAPSGVELSIGGLSRSAPGATGFGRVQWRLDPGAGRLIRRVWTDLQPGPERPPEQGYLSDIRGFQIETYQVLGGWRPGYAPDPRNPDALPLGARITLDHARLGPLEIMVSLR
nr:GspJ family type II secretion system protein [Candidatus Rhodobacter lobularis]